MAADGAPVGREKGRPVARGERGKERVFGRSPEIECLALKPELCTWNAFFFRGSMAFSAARAVFHERGCALRCAKFGSPAAQARRQTRLSRRPPVRRRCRAGASAGCRRWLSRRLSSNIQPWSALGRTRLWVARGRRFHSLWWSPCRKGAPRERARRRAWNLCAAAGSCRAAVVLFMNFVLVCSVTLMVSVGLWYVWTLISFV